MRTVKDSEHEAKRLQRIDEIASSDRLFGLHKNAIEIKGEIVEPLDELWDAEG